MLSIYGNEIILQTIADANWFVIIFRMCVICTLNVLMKLKLFRSRLTEINLTSFKSQFHNLNFQQFTRKK